MERQWIQTLFNTTNCYWLIYGLLKTPRFLFCYYFFKSLDFHILDNYFLKVLPVSIFPPKLTKCLVLAEELKKKERKCLHLNEQFPQKALSQEIEKSEASEAGGRGSAVGHRPSTRPQNSGAVSSVCSLATELTEINNVKYLASQTL